VLPLFFIIIIIEVSQRCSPDLQKHLSSSLLLSFCCRPSGEMSSSDEESLSERSCVSERSFRSERSGGSLSPCAHSTAGSKGDTLPWNLSKHERRKRKSQDSVLDPAERAVVRVADERDRVQKKTFTKWVNKHLIKVRKHITDLYEDLRDGHNLISLLEVLSGVTLPREKGRMRFHRLQNVQIALDFLKQRQVKLVNIRNDDITDGNPKLTLGLIWTIILHFQISEIYVSGESGDLTAKEKLLIWSKQATEGYPGLRCANFSSSWSNGHLFNALLHRYRPDLIDMEVVAQQSNRENLEQAFEIAESLGVTRLLDAEDVDVPSPDEKSVITYVSSIYDAFPKIPEGGEGIAAHEVDQRWTEYQSGFSSLLQWTRQHTALMANRSFPHNPVELKALYNEYVHFKETEIPAKEREKSHIEHLYKLLEAWIEFGRIKLPQGLHPNDLEEEWGKLILEMLEREKALRPAVERLELLLQKANKIQNMAVDCEEKLTLAKNTLQADMSQLENGQPVRCENELGMYLQDCEALIRQLHLDLQVLRDEKYYQVEQLAFSTCFSFMILRSFLSCRVSCLQEELVSLRLHCASVYRKGHFSTGGLLGEHAIQKGSSGGLATLGAQTLLGAVGAAASLLRRPMSRADLVAMSSSEDEGSLRFIYELLGWVEETQDLLLRAEWGSDLPSVEQHLQDHHIIHKAVEDLLNSLKEARNYESRVSPNLRSSYSETLSKLENQYCKLLEHSSWRLRCLESLRTFVSHCTEELIWLNEREEEELAFDWSDSNTNMAAKREQYADMRSELEVKQEVMRSLQETADHLCQENHPAKQTVEAYSAALQTQWQWIKELCICVEQHLKDNTAYFQFTSDARDCESYLRQLQDTIKRQYTCDKNSRLGRLEDLLQDSMEEKEQLIEYRSTVASLVGRAKSVVQLRPRSADSNLGTTTPIRAICDYRQIEITISKGEECVLEDNSQRTKWKVISSTGNEAMVPSVCFTIPPPNQEAIDTASRMEQMYQNVMSLWHQLHVNMKSVVSWHYLHKDIRNIASWSLDTMRLQAPAERQQALDNLEAHLSDFLTDSRESSLFTPTERRELEREAENCREHCQTLLVSLETVEKDELASRAYLSELQSIKSHLEDAESRLMRGMQTPHPSTISGDVHLLMGSQKLQQDLKGLQSDLGEVSRRCVSFFEEKPSSSSVPVLRSELNLAVEHIEKLNSLSSVYLQKLKTVDVLMRSLQAAESQVKKYESRLSEEDIVPADTAAIQALGEQLNKWHSELEEQNNIFESLSLEVQQAREVGNQLNQLHPDRSPELDRYQEKAQQLTERWSGVRRQLETRQADLEMLGSVLQQYREGHSSLIRWIEETTEKQENTQPEQTDSRALSEQLAQQTALVAEIEQNQVKLDECQTHSKQYCAAVKDYELQLMTFRAFVESTQKSPVKRRRMHSSSDVITQEFMDLRTRYTALVTLTTQHVKYINDALRRLEEEEKELEEERQARVGQVSELLGWVKGLQERAGRSAEPSLAAQQVNFGCCLLEYYLFLNTQQTVVYQSTLSRLYVLSGFENTVSGQEIIAGVIDLGTMETFPIFQAAQHGLIDQDTCHVLLEAQVVMGGLFQPDSPDKLSLDKSLSSGLIDKHTYQSLEELEHALGLVNTVKFAEGQDLPVAIAMKEGVIKELVGLRILELQISTGSLKSGSSGEMVSLDNAREKGLLSPDLCQKLQSCLHRRELIDPNTAEKLSLVDFQQRCVVNQETGLRFFPVKQKPGGTVCLCSGRKVGIFCAVQEGLIDRHVTVRLLEAQLFAGGITDPRSGHRLTVNEAVRHGLMDQDLACTLMTRQLETGGIIDPVSGERLELDEAIKRDLLSPRIALRVLESLQSFMAIMWPESGELLPVSEALQQGVVNRELAAKALRKRHSVGAVYLPESGQVVPLHQAEKILKPQAVEILKHIQVQDVLPHVSPSSSLYMKRLSSGSAYSSSPPASHADINYDFSITEEGRSDEQVQNHLLSQVMTHSYINAHSGERLVLLEPELVELICRDIKTANLARPVQLQISDNVRVMLDSKAMSGTEEEKNEELKISQHEIACRDSYMEETVEMAGEDLAPLMVTNRTLKEPLHKVVLQEKVLSSEEYEQPKIKGKIACKITDIGEAVERTEDLAPLTKTNITELSNEEIQQEKVLSSRDYVEPKIKKDEIGGSNINVGESIGLAEQDVPHLASKDRPFIVRSHKENLQEKVLSPGIHEKPKFLKGKIAWTNTDIGETVERAEEDLAPLTGTARDLIVPLHKENLQEKVLPSGQYKEPKIKKDETSSKETNIGEKKERPEEDVAALTGSEITFIEPTHEVVWQEKVRSSGEYEEPIIIKGEIAYKITGMGEMIERAEEDVAPLTDAGRAFVEPLNKDNLQEKVLSSGQPKIKKDETSSKETNIGETKEKPEEDVAALTGSEITFIEPTREVVWQEKVLSSGKFEEPMIMKGKIAYKITGMGEMIERAEGDLAPLTGTEETFMEPLHRVCQEKVLSSGECDESTILKGKVAGKNADVREKIDREEKDLAPLTGKEGTFMEPSREVWQEKILSGECDEPEIKKDEIDWKNTEIGETKVKAEEDLPLLAVSERTFMEPSQEDYWQKDVVSLGQYEEPKIDISKIASKKTDMGETIERTEEYLAPSTGKGLNLTVPFQTSSTLPKTKSDNGAPSQNQIIDSTLNESENKQTLDLEQADNSGVFLKISEQKGESSARTSHQDTVNVRQYDQLNVNPDDAKTAKQSDEPKKIVEHKENKRIFEQPGKDKKLYPLEIKTLSVELSDDDVKLESMALELQQRGLVTVGGQKVLLDEAVAQGLLPGHTAIKLMEEAGLFGGFLDINACKSLSVEDVMQEGLLDEDLMACVLHSEKILAGVIDVEHGRHCSIRDAAEAGLLDSDTAARLLEAQVVSGGIVDLRRDKKLSVTLAANFGLIEEGRKEKLLALEKSCRGKCSDPNAVQTKLALQLQMKGVVDPKTKNAVPLEQALQTGLIGQNEAQTILCQQVAEGGIVHPGSGVRLAVVDALQLGLIDHTVAPKLMELEKEFKGQEPRSLDQNTSLLQASTGSIYDDASKSRITLSEAVSKGLLAAETANKAMDSSNVKSGLLDPHKACIVSYSELINQGKIDIEKRQRFLEVRPFRGVPHKQTDEMMTLPQAIKTGQIDPIPAVRVLQSQADTGGIINIYTGERLPLPEAINKGLVDKDMAKCIATNQLLKGGLLNPASGQKVSSITEAIEYGLISTEMAAELQHSMGLVDEHEKKSSKISASSMKATSSSFVPEMISEHVSPNKMSLEKGLLSIPSPPSSYLTEAKIKDADLRKQEELESFDIRPDLESKEEFVDAVIQDSNDTSLKVLTEFTLKAEKRLQEAIEEIKPTESEHIKSQPIQIPEQPEEMSDFKWQKLEVENSTALLDHTTEMEIKRHTVNVSAFTTAILSESSDNSKEQVPSTEQTTGETEIQRQTVSEPAISEVSFSDTDDGLQNKEQTPSIEQIEGHSFKLEKDQYKPEKIKDSQETGLDPYASTTTRPVKVSGKKKGRGKNGKQAKMESDVKLQVSETSARISPIEKAEVDGQDGFTTNQKRIMKDDKEKLVAVQQSETTHGSGSTAPLTGSDETVQGRDLEIGDDRTDNETKTPKCDTDHETNEKQKEKTQKSVTTYMAKTDQSQEAVVVSKDLGTEVSEKKRKKKSKSKKVKQVCIVETEGVEKIDDETEKEHKMVIHEVQPQSNQSDEKESMKQLEKASQAMAQKEILLMKAKESILRKVFERGVSEKQAAEELEAMRQVASIGEYRITTQEETVVEKTSTKPPQSKKKDNKLHQTGQEINERVERSVPNIAENPLPGSDIDPCSSAKAQLQKPEEDQHDKHTNTGLSGDDMNQNIPSMKTSDDTVDINQKELVLIQNLEDPVIEVTLPSSTAVTDSREIAKSVPLKCVFDIPVMKDSKALLSSEVCTPLQNTKTAVKEASSEVHQERTKEPPFSDYEATDELSIQKVSGLPLMEVISESDTKQKEKVEEYAEALVERQAGAIQMSTEQKNINSDGILYSFYSTHIYISSYSDGIFFTLILFFPLQMLQNSLSARSSEVSNVAFNIQVFISEHAQDLLPDQSRHLLGQLEQLQRVFHQAVGLNHARAEALSAQQARENERMMKEQKEKEEKMEKEKQTTRDREEVEKDLQTKSDQLTETIRSVEEFLSDRGDSLSPEERAKLQGTLSQMKEQHSSLTNSVRSSLAKVDTAIVTTVQQNTQKVKQMQETQEKIDTLLRELSSLDDSKRRSLGYTVTDTPSSGPPENALNSHSDMLQTELQQLQAQQAHLQQVAQSVHSLLEQPDSSVPPEEKQRLRAKLEQLQSQHQERLQNCQDRLRRTDALRDEFAKFVQEHGNLGTWLDQSEQELRILGEGETDAKGLKDRIEEHKKLAEDVICHKADLRFVTISGQKVLDSIQGALEKVGSTDPALEETRHLVSGKLQDATQRYSSLHSKVELGTRLSGLLERFQHYQDEAGSLGSWLSTQEQNQSVFKPSGEQTDTQTLQHTLSTVQLAERSVQLEKVKRAGNELVSTQESPTLKNADINNLTDTLEKRFETLSNSVSVRAEQLQTAVAQSVSVQEGLKALLAWLDGLPLSPGAVQPTAQAVQDALTQNQKLRQELLSRQGSVDATLDSVSKLLKSADASTASGLQGALQDLSQRYTAAQAKQTTRETELRGLLPKLESFERQSADLRSFTQSRERALSPVGQPDCSVDDYKQTIEVRELELHILFFTAEWILLQSKSNPHCLKNSTNMMQFYNYVALSLACWDCTYVNISSLLPSDLTEIQVAVADVNCKYEQLGSDMRERKGKQEASLDLRQKARQSTEALIQWLSPREQSLAQGQTASPSRPEAVHFFNLLCFSIFINTFRFGILLSLLDSRWTKANQTAAHRQTELEACADRLGSFAAAASQLGPWLREKELMMSVLGPLSIDPNMLNTQKQQVQFMLREFETRQPQFDQLSRAAEGILSPSGDEGSRDGQDLEEVRQELADISQQWEGLTSRLTGRSQQIDQAQGTSERYLALLRELSQSVTDLSERLDAQASLSAQPDALRRRLQETGEIRAELEQRRGQLAQAEQLCAELSTIVAELYLRDELHKRLESVSGPLKNLEERAADGLSQLQAALSSTQQFQQMFDELRSWLDGQAGNHTAGASEALPCQPDALKSLLAQQEDLQRAIAQQRGSYELIQAEGTSLLASLPAGDERLALQTRLNTIRQDWEGMNQQTSNKHSRIKETLSRAELYQHHHNELVPWVAECEEREAEIHPSLDPATLDEALQKARQLSLDLDRRRPLLESLNTAADQLLEQSCTGEEEVRDEKAQLNRRIDGLSERLQGRTAQLEELGSRLKEFEDGRLAVERRLEAAKHQIEVQEALGPQACSNKSLERLRSQQELLNSVQPQVVYLRNLAQGLLQDAPEISRAGEDGGQRLLQQARDTEKDFIYLHVSLLFPPQTEQCCSSLESRLQGVGEVQSRVRDVFSRLADLDDELDSLSPVGRDADSLASQADAVRGFLSRLDALRAELESHGGECTTMLRREGSSPDLLALRRETEALSRQAGKLAERGQNRLALIEAAEERVKEFYGRLADLQGLLGRAEEALNTQAVVGTEVEVIKQQLQEFKVGKELIDSIQPKLQHVNAVGQGLIQSAAKHTDTQALEHDLETTNLCWNSLNKRVAERIAQLQEALLHCGKFQDALEPLLSWLSDTEELIANQKPPSVEYRVVKAQIQEQKLLQRLLDDRRGTVEMIRAEGERIAATAETQDRDKIQKQLKSLGERWTNLLEKASARQQQLEELQVLALQFHEAVEPLGEWLSATERRLSSAEPMGTQTSKITQQIVRHKVSSRENGVNHLETLSQSLHPLSCAADRDWLGERVAAVRNGHTELRDWCSRREVMLEQALANAQLFGEEEVEVLNWLAEVAQRLAEVSVQSYQPELLEQQHKHTLALNEEIISRKKTVDQAIKNGQALLKQTTGEEVLLIQEKLDGIKSRYAEMTAGSSKALRTLEQALQLATRFASSHDDISQWLDSVEAELNNIESDTTPAYQDRQRELKCVSAEKRLVLDTVNEVGSALLDLVPWRAREGLDRLVADANQRYRQAEETITQRVQLVQAAIQRSQQYEEAVDAELAWVGETERKLASLGPLSLEPDVTVAQLQVQRAFNIDIIRHKDTVDQLLKTQEDILESCSEQQREALKVKTDSLSARYEAVNQSHAERFSALEQAQVLVARFWETYEELEPWLGETETLITQLPPPAIDTEALRQQQDQMRLLRESIAEHKPHIDKMLKIGPQLAELSAQEGARVRQRYNEAERRYLGIKEEVKGRATALDEAVSQSVQFHDKMDPLLETLEGAVQRLRQPPPVAAEVEKIREQLAEHRATGLELDKLLPSFSALCARGEELISRAPHDDPAAQAVHSRLLRLRSLWDEIRQRAEEREGKLQDVLDLAGKFWADMAALLSTLRDSQDIVKDLEDPGVDPSLIKQQIEAAEAIKAETDGLREELEIVQTLGADLIFACGETEKPEVKKTIDEMNAAWEGLNRTWRERMERLEEAMTASVQYQDALQGMFDYLDNAVIKLCDMPAVGTDLSTVKQQIEELKQYKVEVYQQQIDMEKLSHQGELLLRKVSDQTDRDMIQEPLTELRHLWDNLVDKITIRQHKLEGALLALGQFQHALSELQSWLSHTHATLDTQRPISSDPKAIEIELAKHHVLRNDVLSHRATVETVNSAGSELLESSPGDEINHLRDQLDELNRSWKNLLLKTDERQKLLEAALQQAEGFHGELEEFLQWLRRTESQLSAAKPTGGLPETAREQLQQHMVYKMSSPLVHSLDIQPFSNILLLECLSLCVCLFPQGKLEEAVSLATGFQTSLQDTINWLTQSEQTLNMAQPPSLILDTVLFQIDEHKVFVNEVNTHREQVLALEKAGSQLRFASLKQDVVLIKNLLLSVQARWDKLVQRSLDRGRHLDEARKRAKQFHEAWRKLTDWLEEAESRLDSELEISNEPDKIKIQLAKHKEFQKSLGSKQPVYDTTVRSGKAMRDKATLSADTQKLDNLLGEVRDKWDTVCGKSVERQHKLEEALLFSGQFAEALQAIVDWLYRVEPQLAEDQPVHGDLDLVSNLMDSHKVFQKELGKRTSSVQALKRSARELMETGRDDTAWVKVQVQELSNRWETVCALSVSKQTRLQQALKQAEEFRTAVQMLLEWLSEAEQTLRFRGVLPEEVETLQALLHTHRDFMQTVEEKRVDVNKAASMGEAILAVCHPDCITTIKHWITIIRARFEEVLTWAKQHEQRLETALTELLNNATLLEELLSWLQWAETTLVQRDTEPLPQDITQLKTLISEHQMFMEEMTRKQPDVDKVTKTYKRKPAEHPSSLSDRRGSRKRLYPYQHTYLQVTSGNPRLTQLCSRWQQVWLLALDRQRKLNDALDRLEELKEFANFDFDVWRKKYMRWMNHKKSRVMDFFRRIDKDQDGKITRQEFIDGILASKFPTSKLEMTAVADIFDRDCDGYIDYYEFVAALHPNKDAYRPTTDADKIEDEVTRQVAQCKCAKRFQVEQIGENKYRFFLGNQFGDSQQLRLVRILRSTVMVRVGGGWMALDEFLVKNDPCRARGRTNLELREKFILPEGATQGLAAFRSRGRRSKPSSRTASPTRSSSSASHSAHSCASLPSAPSSQSQSRGYAKPWLAHSKTPTPTKCQSCPEHSQTPGKSFKCGLISTIGKDLSGPASRAGSRAGSRASSRRGSDASDTSELMETRSACSDTSDTPRRPGAKPSKIPTISKKAPSPKTPAGKK
uniref:Microtubule actin crosslinking factor 1 n=1 Tax=Cyprinus carpio TaxID=7962 RepID=A0A8C2BDI7_CYPCA